MGAPSDPNRYAALEVSLTCPKCGSTGLIPWDRLDRVLGCRGCAAFYRVEPHGLVELEKPTDEQFSVEVRSGAGEWQKHKAVVYREPSVGERLREALFDLPTTWRGQAGIAVAVSVLVFWMVTRYSSDAAALAAASLPESLDERAVLVAQAVARRDTGLLLQLTDPMRHRALRIWVVHGKDLPKQVSAEEPDVESTILTNVPTGGSANAATIKVQMRLPPDGEEFFLTQEWVRRADTWYFRPTLVRSPPPPKAEPFRKQRVRNG